MTVPGAENIEIRCSAIVFRQRTVLLVHRPASGADDWVLPGGTPHPGESMVACARREVREETGLSAEPSGVAFVLEASERESGIHTVDLVFLAREHGRRDSPVPVERGLEPHFVSLDELGQLDLRPPLTGHLRGLLARGAPYAPYLGNLWRPMASPNGSGRPSGTA
jgi:8-oxo-dGTP pyrophosphatase MutT (NUDIX family)